MTSMNKLLISSALLLACGSVRADREGNGGQGFRVSGKLTLRDLVDRSTCRWEPAAGIFYAQPTTASMLRSLERVSPIFRNLLESQAAAVNICFTEGDLIQIRSEDKDGVTIWSSEKGVQIATRVGDTVYLDSKKFQQMDATSRTYLLVHEFMHGFLPSDTPQRYMRLRSFVHFLRYNEEHPVSVEKFLYQLEMNQITWQTNIQTLHRYQSLSNDLRAATNSSLTRRQRLESIYRIVTRETYNLRTKKYLWGSEASLLEAADRYYKDIQNEFLTAVLNDDVSGVSALIADGFRVFDIGYHDGYGVFDNNGVFQLFAIENFVSHSSSEHDKSHTYSRMMAWLTSLSLSDEMIDAVSSAEDFDVNVPRPTSYDSPSSAALINTVQKLSEDSSKEHWKALVRLLKHPKIDLKVRNTSGQTALIMVMSNLANQIQRVSQAIKDKYQWFNWFDRSKFHRAMKVVEVLNAYPFDRTAHDNWGKTMSDYVPDDLLADCLTYQKDPSSFPIEPPVWRALVNAYGEKKARSMIANDPTR